MSEEKVSLYKKYLQELLKCRDEESIDDVLNDLFCEVIDVFMEAVGASTIASKIPEDFEVNATTIGETVTVESLAFWYLWHLITTPR